LKIIFFFDLKSFFFPRKQNNVYANIIDALDKRIKIVLYVKMSKFEEWFFERIEYLFIIFIRFDAVGNEKMYTPGFLLSYKKNFVS